MSLFIYTIWNNKAVREYPYTSERMGQSPACS